MNSYFRDDGVEMVETAPGCLSRRDSLGLLGLSPLHVRRAISALQENVTGTGIQPPPLAPSHDDIAPEPTIAPPFQPSHDDLVARVPEPFHRAAAAAPPLVPDLPMSPVHHAPRPKPPKRSIAAILAEADRNHRRKARA